ncbi:MAG: 5'-nucleotidase [bacterium]|nr:5'-nucleotidase [bacterium]
MSHDLSNYLTIAISSRALFDLEKENEIFESEGTSSYELYQIENENKILMPGPGFPLVKAILKLNSKVKDERKTEVVIISRNNPSVSLRIMNSIKRYELDITRAAFTTGTPVSKYLKAFSASLFLSRNSEDVKTALDNKVAAGLLYSSPSNYEEELKEIRIAFDADAVIFSDESELIYKKHGLDAFVKHEQENINRKLPEGPFAAFLKSLSYLQKNSKKTDVQIKLAIITARCSPAHERIIKTLNLWDVRIDEMFFMGGVAKDKILAAFKPHIFFDDQVLHCTPASKVAPTAHVLNDKVK